VLDGWNGLRNFVRITVRNLKGRVIYSGTITMCPDSYTPARVALDSPVTSPYPQFCDASNPFVLGNVWGIQKNWAVDPAQQNGPTVKLAVGTYQVTESVTPVYVSLFHIAPHDASTAVTMTVVKSSGSSRLRATGHGTSDASTAAPPAVPVLKNPPRSALPDINPLPSWAISVARESGRDILSFGATVWVGGNGPLDVEAFRVNGSSAMPAWQYFWSNGQVIGRVRAGTMGFDSRHGNGWHFQQFAAFRLLGGKFELVERSQKQGFCIAPTDEVNLRLANASWQLPTPGMGGRCGSVTTLWVQEFMPVGWGDTYFQSLTGEAFDITNLRNGTYYIEIIANPEHVLRELNSGNDVSLRKIVLSGSPGHRNVEVPAYYGIDPESAGIS
jgi:hypothetical protein